MSSNEQNQDILQQEGKNFSGKTLKRHDSLELESSKVPGVKKVITIIDSYFYCLRTKLIRIHTRKFHIEGLNTLYQYL